VCFATTSLRSLAPSSCLSGRREGFQQKALPPTYARAAHAPELLKCAHECTEHALVSLHLRRIVFLLRDRLSDAALARRSSFENAAARHSVSTHRPLRPFQSFQRRVRRLRLAHVRRLSVLCEDALRLRRAFVSARAGAHLHVAVLAGRHDHRGEQRLARASLPKGCVSVPRVRAARPHASDAVCAAHLRCTLSMHACALPRRRCSAAAARAAPAPGALSRGVVTKACLHLRSRFRQLGELSSQRRSHHRRRRANELACGAGTRPDIRVWHGLPNSRAPRPCRTTRVWRVLWAAAPRRSVARAR
jgi:hypothetical protein